MFGQIPTARSNCRAMFASHIQQTEKAQLSNPHHNIRFMHVFYVLKTSKKNDGVTVFTVITIEQFQTERKISKPGENSLLIDLRSCIQLNL